MSTWPLIFSNSRQKCYVARICWLEWYTWSFKKSCSITIHQLISLTPSISALGLEPTGIQIHLMEIVAPFNTRGKDFSHTIKSNSWFNLRFLREAKSLKFHWLRKNELIAFSHKNTNALIWSLHKGGHVSYMIQ